MILTMELGILKFADDTKIFGRIKGPDDYLRLIHIADVDRLVSQCHQSGHPTLRLVQVQLSDSCLMHNSMNDSEDRYNYIIKHNKQSTIYKNIQYKPKTD